MTATQTQADRGIALRLEGVGRQFPGGVTALRKIDLDIHAGEFLALLGPSGCGKSTLLRLIAGLDAPTDGRIRADRPPSIAYVFQDAHLLPWRTVLENAALPLELAGIGRDVRLARAENALVQVGLSDALGRYPAQLSGGMKMRVSLARALVTEPNLLLLDEPFAALDEITRHRLDEQLRALWIEAGMTVLFVTHSTAEAAFLAERAVVLSRRPARILLDRTLALDSERTAETRGLPAFAYETAALHAALATEEPMP